MRADERPGKSEIDQSLYSRHSAPVQEKLSSASVAVCGLGGLGSHIGIFLARIGVGHLHLIDFDQVELSNLHRQHYFIRHLGRDKTEAMLEQIFEINPYLEVRADRVKLTDSNVLQVLQEDELVCEAFDVPENKAMLIDAVLSRDSGQTVIAASGMAGYGESGLITTRKISERFYLCGDGVSEPGPGMGLMAPRVGLCAAHQANLAVRLILGEQGCGGSAADAAVE